MAADRELKGSKIFLMGPSRLVFPNNVALSL